MTKFGVHMISCVKEKEKIKWVHTYPLFEGEHISDISRKTWLEPKCWVGVAIKFIDYLLSVFLVEVLAVSSWCVWFFVP